MARLGWCCVFLACAPAARPDPVDRSLAATLQRTHFAFEPRAGGFGAGRLQVDADGRAHAQSLAGERLSLQLTHLCRAHGCTALERPQATRLDPATGALVLTWSPDLEERWHREPRGFEQTFALARVPRGDGELRVRLTFAGEPWSRSGDDGHHFGPFRYGEAFALNGAARVPLALRRWERGLDIAVPEALAHGPLLIDPLFAVQEQPLGPPTSTVAPFNQAQVALAFNGTDYLAVWADQRESLDTFTTSAIFAARVDRAGVVLDPFGFRLSGGPTFSNDVAPRVALDGTRWLAVWEEQRVDGGDIAGVHVLPGGTVAESAPIRISPLGTDDRAPDVTCPGPCLVTWVGAGTGVLARRFQPDGGLEPGVIALPSSPTANAVAAASFPSVSNTTKTDWAVVWNEPGDGGELYLALMKADGGAPDAGVKLGACTENARVAIAYDDVDSLAIAHQACGGFIIVTRVGTAGQLDGSPYLVGLGTDPAIAAYDGGLLIASNTVSVPTQVQLTRASPNFMTISTPFVVGTGRDAGESRASPALAANNGDFLVAYTRHGTTDGVNIAAYLDSTNATTNFETLVTRSAAPQFNPVVASDGLDYLAAWSEHRAADRSRIYFARVLRDGGFPGAGATLVNPVTSTGTEQRPALAWAGGLQQYLVVWEENTPVAQRVRASRVSPSGTPLDGPNGLALADPGTLGVVGRPLPAVASDGHRFAAIWAGFSGTNADLAWSLISVDAGAAVVSPANPVTRPFDQTNPAIVWTGSTWLAAWQTSFPDGGVTVSAQDLLQSSAPLDLAFRTARLPALASNGRSVLVIWHDGAAGLQLKAQLLDTAGRADPTLAAQKLADVSEPGNPASVAFDGQQYLVVWRGAAGLEAKRMPPDGGPATPVAMPIRAIGSNGALHPSVAFAAAGVGTVAYERLDTGVGVNRVYVARHGFYRMLALLPQGSGCSSDDDCLSGACAGMICCDTSCVGGTCNTGVCVRTGNMPDGAPCTFPSDCANRFCERGLCCAEACSGACDTCATGRCKPQLDGASCGDALFCNGDELCKDGACNPGLAVKCESQQSCDEDTLACLPDPPQVTAAPATQARCNVEYRYDPQATGAGNTYALVKPPSGAHVGADGVVTWTPTEADIGRHDFQLVVSNESGTDPRGWSVDVAPCRFDFGTPACGCGAGGALPAVGCILLALGRVRRRSRNA